MTNEMLNMKQLDKISGGTNGEYKEIRELLPMITVDNYPDIDGAVGLEDDKYHMNPDEVRGWLKSKLGIDAKIDVGGFWNPLSSAGSRNSYSRNGQVLSHSKVIAEIHNYFGK
ncbi:MAG: hypothetical protein IJ774_03495 [Selenomonadaceae bacterium]|nr:hypothetical protein [Selenomonadaceae bacterium]